MKGALLPKEYKVNRPNETIYLSFSKLPQLFQKRAFIAFLYQAKKEILNLKELKRKYIKENMVDEYWEDYLKSNMPVFEMDLAFFKKIINYGKNSNDKLIEILKEMKDIKVIQLKVKDNMDFKYDFDLVDISEEELSNVKELIITSMITYVKVDFEKKKVYFALPPEVNQYLYYSKNYTQMNLFVIGMINSKYALELYEILLDKYQANKGLMQKRIKPKNEIIETGWIDLEIIYKKLSIEQNDYLRKNFGEFRRRVLNPSIKSLNENELVEFIIEKFETKKTGRKITHLKFYLKERNFEIEDIKIDFKTFRQNLLKQAKEAGDDIFIYLDDEVYELKKGYLFKDGKILKNETALEIWEKLYENKDKIKIKTFEELIKEQEEEFEKIQDIYEKIKELKETYKQIKVKFKNGEKADCAVSDIIYEDGRIKIYLLCDTPLAPISFSTIEEAEEFLQSSI